MKILYLSCHSVLEYDEVSLFKELGHYVFSPGAYVEPENPGDATMRPGLSLGYDPQDVEMFHALGQPGYDNKDRLSKEFVDRFDVVIVMHMPRYIENNWEVMKHKPVVWRTIGQSVPQLERHLSRYRDQGMQIVRYSPRERTLENYMGEDALIRFYKDPDEYGPWNGESRTVMNCTQSMVQRNEWCGYALWERVTSSFSRHIYGPGNEALSYSKGKVPYEELKQAMCTHRCFFYTGTHPASYTLGFIEAWMTGIPIVALGPHYGSAGFLPRPALNQNSAQLGLYEVSQLITNGVNGYWSDDVATLQRYVRSLLNDPAEAKRISERGRQQAVRVFGKPVIKEQWRQFLGSVGG